MYTMQYKLFIAILNIDFKETFMQVHLHWFHCKSQVSMILRHGGGFNIQSKISFLPLLSMGNVKNHDFRLSMAF